MHSGEIPQSFTDRRLGALSTAEIWRSSIISFQRPLWPVSWNRYNAMDNVSCLIIRAGFVRGLGVSTP